MKRKMMVAFLAVRLFLCGVAYAETEEMRIALQDTLIQLEETYGSELLAQERVQLSFIIDWVDRYVQNSEWERFVEELNQCKDSKTLSEWLTRDYIGITQAPEGQVQREKIWQKGIDILQSSGLVGDHVLYFSMGNKGIRADGTSGGWLVVASGIPGEEQVTPHVTMEFAGNGNLQYMEYVFPGEKEDGTSITAEQARAIAIEFVTQYIFTDTEAEKTGLEWDCVVQEEKSYWEVNCISQTDERQCTIRIGKETGHIYFVETYIRG